MWKIHLKINCLQLTRWQFNHFKMCNSASWAHHSLPVDFGEHSSRHQCTMCSSSIVHANSKPLPFFMSGHVCHLIVFSPICPASLFYAHQLCLFLVSHATLQQWGLADSMTELSEGKGINIVCCIPGRLWGKIELLIALILLCCHHKM